MKRHGMLILVLLLSLVYTGNVFAINVEQMTSFSEWGGNSWVGWDEIVYDPNVISGDGAAVNINVKGDSRAGVYAHIRDRDRTDVIGMLATIQVSEIKGHSQAGIRSTIGKIGNNRIEVWLSLSNWHGDHRRIQYYIRYKNLQTDERTDITTGIIGNYWGGGWELDENVIFGFVRVENEIWFYVSGHAGFARWTFDAPVEDFGMGPEIFGYTADSNERDFVKAKITDVYLFKK